MSDVHVLRCASPTSLTKLSGHTGKSADTKAVPLSFHISYYTMQQLNAPASLWGPKWCSNGPSPSTASYPPSPTLHCVPLLSRPLFPPFPYRIRGPDGYAGIRLASEYLAVSVDACNQRVLRPTLRSTLRLLPTANCTYPPLSHVVYINMFVYVCMCRQFERSDPPQVAHLS